MSMSGGNEQFTVYLSASVHDRSIRQVFVIPWKSLRRQQKRQTLDAVGGGCKEKCMAILDSMATNSGQHYLQLFQ